MKETAMQEPTGGAEAPPTTRTLSQAELEACELEAHASVPEGATEEEAHEAYAKALRKLVRKRQRTAPTTRSIVYLARFDEDDED